MEVAAGIDEARLQTCVGFNDAVQPPLANIFTLVTNLLEGHLPCDTCETAATFICGEAADAVLACDKCAMQHINCTECYSVDKLQVTLHAHAVATLLPNPLDVEGCGFVVHGTLHILEDVQLFSPRGDTLPKEEWVFNMPTTKAPGNEMRKLNFASFEQYAIPTQPRGKELFLAVAKSWVLQESSRDFPAFNLVNKLPSKGPLSTPPLESESIAQLLGERMDTIMQTMQNNDWRFQVLTNIDTLDPLTAKLHHAEPPSDLPAYAPAPSSAAQKLLSKLRERSPKPNWIPVRVGRKQLGPFAWSNPRHASAKDDDWAAGPGIGVPQLFAGFAGKLCSFGFHEESYGCDFVNITSNDAEPVRWKFINKTPDHLTALMLLYSRTHSSMQPTWFKNVVLSDATLRAVGIHFEEKVQTAGVAICGHQFHMGVGGYKVAEAHSWFSAEWRLLRTWQEGFPPCFLMAQGEAASDPSMRKLSKTPDAQGAAAAAAPSMQHPPARNRALPSVAEHGSVAASAQRGGGVRGRGRGGRGRGRGGKAKAHPSSTQDEEEEEEED